MTATLTELRAGDVCRLAGISHRELDHWISTGRFIASGPPSSGGPGNHRTFTMADVYRLRAVKARREWGMELDAAFRTVDPPLPAPPAPPPS